MDLKIVVDDAVRAVQPAGDAKNVRITTEADSWLGFIQGDSARLEQVVCEPAVERGQVHARRWHRSCRS